MVFTEKEEAILRKIIDKTVLEMQLEAIRDEENSRLFALQNQISDARTAVKLECNKE